MCTEMFVTHTAPEIVSCIVKISVLMYTEDCTAAELACIFTAAPSECSKELQRDKIGGYQGMILSEQLNTAVTAATGNPACSHQHALSGT